ncbi:VMAP-C domain-containing protein [Streptomyces sp. NBC_01803]|uniref:VMAP-C domain-containing protein n=1 Tax=Streptomyces sp. NBC_01803 TaxID=2975946 RepID=UPI002DD7E6A4|nr:trypsin-like peptidase domain-containing protein [Streptomyces sp. NBC_01803]WSA44299.1 serine protease [Streptomyces sp. NBC_01803]
MTWGDTGGAQPLDVDPFETLAPLAAKATVRIHEAPTGYDGTGRVSRPWGSGFFVAPSWVLTCAHVALRGGSGGRGEGGRREVGLTVQGVERPVRGRVEWAQPEEHPGGGLWPAPDLALIRLLEPIPHSCVWLSERTAKVFTRSEVAFFGSAEVGDGFAEDVSGRCTIRGELGSEGLMKLGNEDEVPEGASGGPVVDLRRGEVIGVLKARRSIGRDGGLASSVVQLRRLPSPVGQVLDEHDDLYQSVLHAHDRHHAERHRDAQITDRTWTDAQIEVRGTAGRALTPGQRVELLGLLAELPPPVSTRRLDETLTALRGRPYEGTLPAPRGWRDGLGLLYDLRQGVTELEAVLRYAMYAATAERPFPAASPEAESRLLDWVHGTAAASAELPRWFRHNLRSEQDARLGERDGVPAGWGAAPRLDPGSGFGQDFGQDLDPEDFGLDVTPAITGSAAGLWDLAAGFQDTAGGDGFAEVGGQPYVLLEITPRAWERGRYDWRVCAARTTGELTSVDEDFRAVGPDEPPERLRVALAEAFRRGDEPDQPVALHVALPYALLGFPVEEWRLAPDASPLGEQRPVVIRCTNPVPDAEDSEELHALRQTRWAKIHAGRMEPDVLDCADGRARPLPQPAGLIGRDPATVPVMCHTPATGGEPAALHRVMASGYNVILWRREDTDRERDCDDFHRGVTRTVGMAGQARLLPTALWQLRSALGLGVPDVSWSRGLSLLYDDPGRPLPGTDDPLETP